MGDLGQKAVQLLEHHGRPEGCHVYIIAGLCDVTTRHVAHQPGRGKYEEVVFQGTVNQNVTRMIALIDSVDQAVRATGATPCFATIIPMSLETWSKNRLRQHKTTHLNNQNLYSTWQPLLIETIKAVNQHIISINISNQMTTPHLADTIMTHTRNRTRIHYGRLSDGTHLNSTTNSKCKIKLINSIKSNRERYPHY